MGDKNVYKLRNYFIVCNNFCNFLGIRIILRGILIKWFYIVFFYNVKKGGIDNEVVFYDG